MKKREGKFRAFIKGGAFFALLCLMAKGIGALYRIPLTNIMGAEGIGLYQIVFPLYSVLLTVSGGGLPSAISKTVSSFHAEGAEENARRTLYISLAVLTAAGAVGSALLFFFRGRIAALQGNPDAAIAYVGIAPAVVLVSVISCFRGYFQGKLDMLPSGISQVVEQVVKMIAGLVLCSRLLVYGVPYAALGALLGVSISELAPARCCSFSTRSTLAAAENATLSYSGRLRRKPPRILPCNSPNRCAIAPFYGASLR